MRNTKHSEVGQQLRLQLTVDFQDKAVHLTTAHPFALAVQPNEV